MADAVRPIVELAVLAAALLVAGLLALLQRRPERIPEWPPSPPQPPRRRRRVATVGGSGLLLAGVMVGILVSTAAALELSGTSRAVAVDSYTDGAVDAIVPDAVQPEQVPAPSIPPDARVGPAIESEPQPDGHQRHQPARGTPNQAW